MPLTKITFFDTIRENKIKEMKMIKKLRKFSNMTILFVTSDDNLRNELKEQFKDCKGIIDFDDKSSEEVLEEKYDILLVDYNCKFSLDIMDRVRFTKPLVPKIVLLSNVNEVDIVSCINISSYSILKMPLEYDDLRLSMIMALNQSKRADKILLNNNIYYDAYRERFYNEDGAISLTKFEFQVLKLLLDNHTRIISYDEIQEKVWKDKKMSIFTMRNVINKIRNKTYYDIIRNNSSKGYQIDKIN